jgi:hypothetical protein
MGWMNQVSNPGRGKTFFPFPRYPDWLWGPHNLLFSGYWGSLQVVKWLGHEVDHSSPSNAEVQCDWNCTLPYMPSWQGFLRCACFIDDAFFFMVKSIADHVWIVTSAAM